MANPEHLQILLKGFEAWNAWRGQHWDIFPDLSGADFRRVNLSGAILRRATLRRVNLSGVNLSGVNLVRTDLSRADLHRVDLRRADLHGADLSGANLSEVRLHETGFSDADLTSVRGLETCIHLGPSTLDHRTFAKSGMLPLAFLRGCGLSEWEIEVTKLYDSRLTAGQVTDILYRIYPLRTDPLIQFYSCFISYNHTDAVLGFPQ
jgi:uncharacterized protein YjbI with pentapeptide repeats